MLAQDPDFTINMAQPLITLCITGKPINLLISTGVAYSALSEFTGLLSPSFIIIIGGGGRTLKAL
jgi:hypothetical protein